jgi:Tol biopolymer transport system component
MTRIALIVLTVALVAQGVVAQDLERLFKSAVNTETVDRNCKAAIEQYRKVAAGSNRALAAQALLRMAGCYQQLGDAEAQRIYGRIIKEYADQPEVLVVARSRLQSVAAASAVPSGELTRRIVPVWTGQGVGYGRPSIDGRYIAFLDGADVAIRDVSTNTTRRLTKAGGWVASGDFARDPIVSPDNRFVAYTWFIEAEGMSELRVVSLQGDTPRTLIRADERYPMPVAWTPDGMRLIVLRRVGNALQLGTVALGDSRYQVVKSFEPGRGSLTASSDGRYVAYHIASSDSQSKRDIVVVAPDGSETATLVGPEDDFDPLWSPDGAHLIFKRADTGGVALWVLRMQDGRPDGKPILLRSDLGRMNPLGVTRSGSLYYALNGAQRHDIYIAQLDGAVVSTSTLVASQVFDGRTGPAWTPDGELLTYWAVSPQPGITLRSIKNGQERTIALPPRTVTNSASPKWFPDGRSLLIPVAAEGGGIALSRFYLETGVVERLATGGIVSFAVAPDGSAIYWATAIGANAARPTGRLIRLDLKTREQQELKRNEWFLAIVVSPDGKEVAYLRNTRTENDRGRNEAPGYLEVIPSNGGESRLVFRDPVWYGPSRNNTLAWTADQQNLVAVRDDGVLWRFPLNGGAPQSMGISAQRYLFGGGQSQSSSPADARVKSPAFHPTTNVLAFAVAEIQDREIWSLENFLPAVNGRN